MAVREVMKWIIKREAWLAKHEPKVPQPTTLLTSGDPDNADAALVLLGIAAPIPIVRILAKLAFSFSSSHGRLRRRSAAGGVANL